MSSDDHGRKKKHASLNNMKIGRITPYFPTANQVKVVGVCVMADHQQFGVALSASCLIGLIS
jgi:hypothetical protein